VFASEAISRRARRLAATAVQRTWRWAGGVAAVSPDDPSSRRFLHLGTGSSLAFPPGDVYGEQHIRIGEGTLIGVFVSLAVGMPGEILYDRAEPIITIGDRCLIGRSSSVIARCRIDIEDDVTIAPNVYITDHNHTYGDVGMPIGRQFPAEDAVRIGAGSWLASGVVVLPGARIGRHVTVAAGSVVRGEIPDFSVAAGVPAKVVRRYRTGVGWEPPLPVTVVPPEGWPRT